MATVAQLLREAETLLDKPSRTDAELLLAHALAQPRSWLYSHSEDRLDDILGRNFFALIERRRHGEPVAQIVGHRDFWSLDLSITPDTLIPRPETEALVELALQRLPVNMPLRVLDMGTGSGAIALAIAQERPQVQMTATDLSGAALALARANAQKFGLTSVQFLESDWFSALPGERFDMVVSNPPYIAEHDPHLQQGDLRFEPRLALVSGADGLAALRIIAAQASDHLRPGGWLLLEHGWQQGEAVRELLSLAGLSAIETVRDLENRERVTLGNL